MSLSKGDRIGPYEILALVGKGGMGEVYRAHDGRLRRDVAIKVSNSQFTERFAREARTIASLNHTNICHLYDVGPNYLVMEYVEGEDLKGPLDFADALPILLQLIDGIEAAHEKNVVHRDLKPANIKITPDGVVKILDFGLAKAMEPASSSEADPENSPTLTMGATVAGTILGTAAYMAPEQAKGKTADKRSDIWSFGVVMHEVLTGKRLFRGESVVEILGAVLNKEADISAAPARVHKLLRWCLEKDRKQRLASISDARMLLGDGGTEIARHAASQPPTYRNLAWAVAAGLGMIAAAFAGVRYGTTKPEVERQAVRFQIPVQPASGLRPLGAISPDGLSLAYFDVLLDGRLALKIRAMSSGESTEYPAAEMAQPTYIFWSPDSKMIYFGSRRFLKRMDLARGTVQQICDCSSDGGAVNQDGLILLGSTPSQHELMQVSASGEITFVRKGANENSLPGFPSFLPDGRRYLFTENGGLFLASLDTPEQPARRLWDTQERFSLVPGLGGMFLLFNQSDQLDVLPFDPQKGEIAGPPTTLKLSGVSERLSATSASTSGTLLRLVSTEPRQSAVWIDREGKRAGDVGTVEGYVALDLSHDGSRLAEIGNSSGLRIRDLARGTVVRIAQQIRPEGSAIWSPDDRFVVFTARDKNRVQRLYRADVDNAQPESVILEEQGLHWPNDWSRDGKYLLYGFDEGKTSRDLWALPMDQPGAKPFQYTHGASLIKQGQFSPDGRFVAYTSDESGQYEVYVQPFPDASKGKWVISQGGGVEPTWSRDGRELFFFTGQKMMAVEVRENNGALRASVPRALFSAAIPVGYSNDSHRWQLSPDGKRFLLLVPSSGAATASLDVVIHWEQLLKQ